MWSQLRNQRPVEDLLGIVGKPNGSEPKPKPLPRAVAGNCGAAWRPVYSVFRKGLVITILGLLLLGVLPSPTLAADALAPIDLRRVKVGGEIGRRIHVTIDNNLLVLDADKDFLRPFVRKDRRSGYVGLGKLIDATVRFSVHSGDEKVIALKNHLIDSVIQAQESDGYGGMFVKENRMTGLWDVHEMAYLIYALCTDYEYFGQNRSLEAARKAADYIVSRWSNIPDDWGQETGVATHVAVTGLERAMLALGRLTKDSKYIDFCREQRGLPTWDLGIVLGRRPLIEGHMYAYLCRCLAQLELHRMKPDKMLLQQSQRAVNFLTDGNGMTITGGGGQWETWTDDQDGRGALAETCATAYQIRLLESLLRLNGQPRFGDLMERTIYNTLFAAQSPDGRNIRYYSPLEGPREYHPGDTYCCPCNYRRIIAELPGMVYYRAGNGLLVNLFTASKAQMELADGSLVTIGQETDYPTSGDVLIRIDPAQAADFAVQVRVPAWCQSARVTVNHEPAKPARGGSFYRVQRTWKAGDSIRLEMPMKWRLVRGRLRQSGRVAVMRGPLVFCLNPQQDQELARQDGAALGQITLDPRSLGAPIRDDSVRPHGLACSVEGWKPGYACKRPGNLKLRLTEFADPSGRAVYFRLQDFSDTTPDELVGRNGP